MSVVSVVCLLGYFRCFWVFVVYGLEPIGGSVLGVHRVVGLGDEVRWSVRWKGEVVGMVIG